MVVVSAVMSIAIGSALACLSDRYPTIAGRIETMGGLCFVGGLAMIGAGLPIFQ